MFGILKRKFRVLLLPSEYKLDIQARLPVALAFIHNFAKECDANGIPPATTESDVEDPPAESEPEMEEEASSDLGEVRSTAYVRDQIAGAMWDAYIQKGGEDIINNLLDGEETKGLDDDEQILI